MELTADADCPVCIIAIDGKVPFANRAFDELCRLKRPRDETAKLDTWLPPKLAQERLHWVKTVVADGRPRTLLDMVNGKRFISTLRCVEATPWANCAIMMMSLRPPRREELAGLIRLQERDMGPLDPLTERELDVLRLIAEGYSQREAAQKLSRTVKTIESHRAAIGRKLRLKKNIHLAQLALAAGLLDEQLGVDGSAGSDPRNQNGSA